MADKAISDLSEALQIQLNDWFVLQQGSEAKKLSGNTLRQYLSQVEINSIQSVTFDAQGRCHILLADGTEIISQPLKGADGTDGTDGVDAPTITNIAIDASYHLIVTLSDGTSYDAGYCRGASGAGTGDMLASVYDAAAPTGGRSEPKQVAFSDDVVPKTDYDPAAKTAEMTQAVGKDENGKLWTIPAPQGTFLPLSGGTMSGGINMDGSAVTGLPAPTNDSDAANKAYVDTLRQVVEIIPVKFYEGSSLSPKTYPGSGSEGFVENFDAVLKYPINIEDFDVIRIKLRVFGVYLPGTSSANVLSFYGHLIDADDNRMNEFVSLSQTDDEPLTFPTAVRSETVYHKNEDGVFEFSCTKYDRVPEYESGAYVPRFQPKWEQMSIRAGGMSTGTIHKIRLKRANTDPLQTFGAVAEIEAIKYANAQ